MTPRPNPIGWRAVILAAAVMSASPAAGQSFLERRLAALEPCAPVQITQQVFGVDVTVGLPRVQSLEVETAALQIVGDRAVVSLTGTLVCAAGPDSVLQGDAGLGLAAQADVSLADCSVVWVQITPTGFSGGLADLVEAAWEPVLHPLLTEAADGWLRQTCRDLTAEE